MRRNKFWQTKRLFLVITWLCSNFAAPLFALDLTPDQFAVEVIHELNRGQQLIKNGEKDQGRRVIDEINQKVYEHGHILGDRKEHFLPNLVLARIYRKESNFEDAQEFSLSVVRGLDSDEFRKSLERLEALGILGESLRKLKRNQEAEPILREMLTLAQQHGDLGKMLLRAQYHLAFVVTANNAPDAAEMRKKIIADVQASKYANDANIVAIRHMDLKTRRNKKAEKTALVADARSLLEFLKTAKKVTDHNASIARVIIANILAESNYLKEGRDLIVERIAYLKEAKPASVSYYYAIENLVSVTTRQKKYDTALKLAQETLDELQDSGKKFAHVRSALQYNAGNNAKYLKQHTLAQEYYRASYASRREVVSANHPRALKIRKRIDVDLVDPDTYAFAAELGITKSAPLTLLPTGETVLAAFMQGNYLSLKAKLDRLKKTKGADQVLLGLNTALYYALIGELHASDKELSKARKLSRTSTTSNVPINSPYFDIVSALSKVWATEWNIEDAINPLKRLAARHDLTALERGILLALQLQMASSNEDQWLSTQSLASLRTLAPEINEASYWRVLIDIAHINAAYKELPRAEADEVYKQANVRLGKLMNPRLATILVRMGKANSAHGVLLSDENMQILASDTKALGKMLPETFITNVNALLLYSDGLFYRGDIKKSLKLKQQATDLYRRSPYHRPEIAAYLIMSQGKLRYQLGDKKLGLSIIQATYNGLDIKHAFPRFVQSIVTDYTYILIDSGQNEKAVDAIKPYAANTKWVSSLKPIDRMYLLAAYSRALRHSGDKEGARVAILRAKDALPFDLYQSGQPMSSTLWELAFINYDLNLSADAYTAMRQSNILYFDFIEASESEQDTDIIRNTKDDYTRLSHETLLGWDYAQKLKGLPQ